MAFVRFNATIYYGVPTQHNLETAYTIAIVGVFPIKAVVRYMGQKNITLKGGSRTIRALFIPG